ncbi:hypothetical protein MY11210_003057 [Beauveria gryllotalpidicola]
MALPGIPAPGPQEAESHVLQQYEKIIRFRDEILAGQHATIKIPGHLRKAALSLSTDAFHGLSPGKLPGQSNKAFASNAQHAVGTSSIATADAALPAEFRPVSLSKSDQLLRAELQIQRKRIEQELQEDAERNGKGKLGLGTQNDIDASAILADALILVPESRLSAQKEEGFDSGNGPENDSFDDNTFYSSQHDTPEFEPAPPVPAGSAALAHPTPAKTPAANTIPAKTQDARRSVNRPRQLRTYDELTEPSTAKEQPSAVPGLNNYTDSSVANLSKPNIIAPSATASVVGQTAPTQPSSYIDLHPPSPLLRNNGQVTPIYPSTSYPVQPPQTSEIPGLYKSTQNSALSTGAPAQVAVLRSEPGSRTSPDSSSHGGQSKGKNKKKKRKSDRLALESQQSTESKTPHIKAEPRSPSPLAGPSYMRPNKRQRQGKPQKQNSSHDDSSYDPAMPGVPINPNEPYSQAHNRQELAQANHEGSGMYLATAAAIPSATRTPREYVTERVITDDGYRREHVPQVALPYEYSSRGPHIGRPVHSDVYQDSVMPYRNSSQPTRYSVHPEGDAFHDPTRPQPARILVDAYGREYIEPVRQMMRHSIAPPPLAGDPDRLYERVPTQPLARYQVEGAVEERGYMFAQASSPYAASRRILTQPEYVAYENREGRYREYSARPLPSPGEFVPVRTQEHRIYAEGGREYIGRASSMHAMEQTRIASGLGPYGHASSVRPEASGVVYGIERSAQPAAIKGYGAWPGNQGMMERDGGSSLYPAATSSEAVSSRGVAGQDSLYGRGNMQDGFR